MGLFSGSQGWAESLKARRTAQEAKRTKRKETQAKKKEWRKKSREGAKKIRSEHKAGSEGRKAMLRANRDFHKTDKEGKPGGYPAVFSSARKPREKAERVAARKAKAAARKKARADKRAAKKKGLTPESDSSGSEETR